MREGLVSVSRGNAIDGSSDDDGNASIGIEVELRDHGSESGEWQCCCPHY